MNIKRGIAKLLLKKVKPSHLAFVNVGFTADGGDYCMGDLRIYDGSYYYGITGDRVPIDNMQQVSDLVYGHTHYLVLENA